MTLEDAQKFVDKRDRLTAFLLSDDFKEFFQEGYFEKEASRLAQAITNPNMQDDIDQREIDGQFRAIGHVQNYLLTIKQQGDAKEHAIKEHEDELARLEAERNQKMIDEAKTMEVDPITGEEYEVKED